MAKKAGKNFNRAYWQTAYTDFCGFFLQQHHNEPHSTKQIEDAIGRAADRDGGMPAMTLDTLNRGIYQVDEDMYRKVQ